MKRNFIDVLLVALSSFLIYFGNPLVLEINLFLLILLTLLNNNYYSVLSLIPLIFINPELFFIFLIIYVSLSFVNHQIKNRYYKNLSIATLSLAYIILGRMLIYDSTTFMMFQVCLITPAIAINTFNLNNSKFIKSEILILSLSLLNIVYINPYLYLLLYMIFIFITINTYNTYFYIFTAFLITIYSVVITDNLVYVLIQIMAYLGFLYLLLRKKTNTENAAEYIIEDINLNVTNFCAFLNQFSSINSNNDYEKRVSSSIKILIESYCSTCKERVNCYGNKKLKTYIFLKELLTKEKQINSSNENEKFFECKYYFYMCEKALKLQKQYQLIQQENKDEEVLSNLCSSIQNYFISLFEKLSPQTIRLINFKNYLVEQNILFTKFEYSIKNEDEYSFKIHANKSADLIIIKDKADEYFKRSRSLIELKNDHITISPKKIYKVIYDYASLSNNNCQISGDNIMFKSTNNANFICALSDGMGSGYHAYKLSQETLKMVDLITNCNISFDASLQILNNFFKAKDANDSYATLDLIEINLITGILNLYKLGSSTTYLSRSGKIIPIYNNSLPFGISDLITKEQFSISNNDLIILVSDGINDYINEDKLINFIETIKNESPHKIVYEILQKIYYDNGKVIKDDMSCVVIKINII